MSLDVTTSKELLSYILPDDGIMILLVIAGTRHRQMAEETFYIQG